jgi:hypothetical protein
MLPNLTTEVKELCAKEQGLKAIATDTLYQETRCKEKEKNTRQNKESLMEIMLLLSPSSTTASSCRR